MRFEGKTVLVTGATGFLGGEIARKLAEEGAQVKALARRPNRDRYIQNIDNIEIVMGDVLDAARMKAVMQGCDYVFHVAAALGGPLSQQRPINVEGTRNVMMAAAETGVSRVVHVSTIAVYGYVYTSDVEEEMPHQPGRVPYNVTKAEAEAIVRDIGAQHHVPYSIIRPGMIYGPRSSGWTTTMFRLGKRRPTPFLGDGSGYSHPIYVEDVVDLTLLLATHPDASGEAFNCAPDPAPTWRAFIGGYSQLAGHQQWLPIPVSLVKIFAPLIDSFLTLRGEPQDLSTLIPFMMSKKVYKMDKARALLDWQAKVSLQDGLERCVPYLREKGLMK